MGKMMREKFGDIKNENVTFDWFAQYATTRLLTNCYSEGEKATTFILHPVNIIISIDTLLDTYRRILNLCVTTLAVSPLK